MLFTKPMSSIDVVIVNRRTGATRRTRTDSDGVFTVKGLPRGRYLAFAGAPGSKTDDVLFSLPSRGPISRPGIDTWIEIQFLIRGFGAIPPTYYHRRAAHPTHTPVARPRPTSAPTPRPYASPTTEPSPSARPRQSPEPSLRPWQGSHDDSTQNAEEARADDIIDRLSSGHIAYNSPDEMQVDRNETVEVRVSRLALPELTEGFHGGGPVREEPLKVDDYMGMTLTGTEGYFSIVRQSGDEKQLLAGTEPAVWLFDVLPMKAGTAKLTLTASVIFDTPRGERAYDGGKPVFVREIKVSTAPKPSFALAIWRFFAKNWDKLIGALVALVGLAGGLLPWLKKRRGVKRGPPKWQSPS